MTDDEIRELTELEAQVRGALELMNVAAERLQALSAHEQGERKYPMGADHFPRVAQEAANEALAQATLLGIEVEEEGAAPPAGLTDELGIAWRQLKWLQNHLSQAVIKEIP